MNIYRINDYEWVAGSTLESAREWYKEMTGERADDDAAQLDDAELDRLTFTDFEGDFGPEAGRYTFRQALAFFTEPTLISSEY